MGFDHFREQNLLNCNESKVTLKIIIELNTGRIFFYIKYILFVFIQTL